MSGLLIVAGVWALGLGALWWAVNRAPECSCNRPDCGAGCIRR